MKIIEAHGAKIPAIGLGTMTLKDDKCVEVVAQAIKDGYRHIDTAERYGNEKAVGDGLRASGAKRDDFFVTTKVYWTDAKPDDFMRTVENSLRSLDVSDVDLLLIHWPNPNVPLAETVGALCKAKREGMTRHIGVANFTTALLEEANHVTKEPLVNNQIEVHPYLDQTKVIAACRKFGMAVTAYCPLGRGRLPSDETLARIGEEHGKSPSQVALHWLVQQDIVPIPRTANPEHLAENLDVFGFTLSDDEMAKIAALKRPDGRGTNPPHSPKWDS